jgi:hypothetical protein
VRQGEKLGEVRVYDRGKVVARSPLVAARSVEEPSAIDRAGWYAGETAQNVWGWIS